MPDKTIAQQAAAAAFTGTELFEVEQLGVTKKATATQVVALEAAERLAAAAAHAATPHGGGGGSPLTSFPNADPLRLSKLPFVVSGRAGQNTRSYSAPLWTEGTTQYAVMSSRVARTSPAVPSVILANSGTAASGVALSLTRGTTTPENATLLAVVAVAGATASSTITPPASQGWEQVGVAINSGNVVLWAFAKVHTTFLGSTGPFAFVRSDTTNTAAWALYSITGAQESGYPLMAVADVTGTGTAVVPPVITTTVANSLVVSLVATAAGNTVTPDAAYAQNFDINPAAAPSLFGATVTKATVGATTAASHTLSTSAAFAELEIAVAPAVDEDRPMISKRSLPDGVWETPVDLSLVASNTIGSPLPLNEHNSLVVAVGADGRVYVIGNMHAQAPPLRMIRTTATNGSISGTWEAVTITGFNGYVTYPQFLKVTNGDLLLFARTTAPSPRAWQYARLSAGVWGAAVNLIDGTTPDYGPYADQLTQDPTNLNKIGCFFVWRVVTSSADNKDLSYIESLDGGFTWKKSNGTTLTLPVLHTVQLVSSTRNAEVIDASTTVLNQDGCCISTTGVPQKVYRKTNGSGVKRHYHTYRTGTTWTIRELPAFTVDWQRGPLFAAPEGRVLNIANGWASGTRNVVQVLEVTPSVTLFDSQPLVAWDLGNSECPIDQRDALINNRLSLLVTASEKMFRTNYEDDLNWINQPGYVLTLGGDRLWEVQRDMHRVTGVQLVSMGSLSVPQRVITTLPLRTDIECTVPIDQSWAGSQLMARARVRGHVLASNGVMIVSLIEHLAPSTDTEVGRMIFSSTTEDGKDIPWVPLVASDEGHVRLRAAMQSTTPAVASGPFTGQPGYGRITSATIEIAKVDT